MDGLGRRAQKGSRYKRERQRLATRRCRAKKGKDEHRSTQDNKQDQPTQDNSKQDVLIHNLNSSDRLLGKQLLD
jgi:hypothetical protein